MGDVVAHGPNRAGQWHALSDHARGTAQRCAAFADRLGLAPAGYLVGLLHDVGKAAPDWQARLRQVVGTPGRVGIDHKAAASTILDATPHVVPLGLVAFGHHGGLLDPGSYAREQQARLTARPQQALAAVQWAAATFGHELQPALPPVGPWDPHTVEMMTRLLYSCLIDADRSDTQAHAEADERTAPPLAVELAERFWAKLPELGSACSGPVRAVRQDLMAQARAAALLPGGMSPPAVESCAGRPRDPHSDMAGVATPLPSSGGVVRQPGLVGLDALVRTDISLQ